MSYLHKQSNIPVPHHRDPSLAEELPDYQVVCKIVYFRRPKMVSSMLAVCAERYYILLLLLLLLLLRLLIEPLILPAANRAFASLSHRFTS